MSPTLVRDGVLRWRDLGPIGMVKLEHLEVIAWKMTYGMGVQDVRLASMAPDDRSCNLSINLQPID